MHIFLKVLSVLLIIGAIIGLLNDGGMVAAVVLALGIGGCWLTMAR